MEIRIHRKENMLFGLRIIFTIIVSLVVINTVSSFVRVNDLSILSTLAVFGIYIVFFALYFLFQKVYLIAFLKGNGIEINRNQFPEVYEEYTKMVRELGLKTSPKLFIIQQGGLLNAFAVRFSGKNYIALYSDIFGLFSKDSNAVKFVLAHELGHVRQNHLIKRFWTLPSTIVPFLAPAYSRSCEYTCDNIASQLVPENALNGLLVLAAGTEVYGKINVDAYLEDSRSNYSMSVRLVNLIISHPYLPKRILNIRQWR